jgi:hypothetical protein
MDEHASWVADSRDIAGLSAWECWAAHAGYVAEGMLYLLIGTFALLATIDSSRHPNGSHGALLQLSLTGPGEWLLAVVALGLACFVTWQLLVAIRDPEHRRDKRQRYRVLLRLEHLFSAALHSVLVIEAMRILFGFGGGSNSEQSQKLWIARAFAVPLGRYLVGVVGMSIFFYGVYQCYRAVTRRRDSRVDLTRTRLRPVLDVLGIFGLLSRGAMFCVIALYLMRATWQHHAAYAVGIAGALGTLRQQPYGQWMLGAMAAGLISYGLWQIVKEPYRRLRDS